MLSTSRKYFLSFLIFCNPIYLLTLINRDYLLELNRSRSNCLLFDGGGETLRGGILDVDCAVLGDRGILNLFLLIFEGRILTELRGRVPLICCSILFLGCRRVCRCLLCRRILPVFVNYLRPLLMIDVLRLTVGLLVGDWID